MSTEVGRPITVVSPRTGEVLTLDAGTDQLAGLLADFSEHEAVVKESKRYVQDELLRRLDSAAQWTMHVEGGLKISAPSPAPAEEFDELALRESLLQLADDHVIAIEAVDRAVEPQVSYKARKAGVNALRKLGGRVAETVDAHARSAEHKRYVRVERS
jgi:hypothetical protein